MLLAGVLFPDYLLLISGNIIDCRFYWPGGSLPSSLNTSASTGGFVLPSSQIKVALFWLFAGILGL